MSIQQQDQHWNAGATEIQQLNPGGPDQRQSIELQPTWLKVFRLHSVWGPTRRRAIKEGSKVVNRDWVHHKTCSLSHNIYLVASSFITNGYFSKLIRKIITLKNFSICTWSCHKIRVLTGHVWEKIWVRHNVEKSQEKQTHKVEELDSRIRVNF